MIDEIREGGTSFISLTFGNQDDEATPPKSATYRIDDVGSGAEIRADTDVQPTATGVEILLTSEDTRIVDQSKPYETRRVTVRWTYTPDALPDDEIEGEPLEYLYHVINLQGVTEE